MGGAVVFAPLGTYPSWLSLGPHEFVRVLRRHGSAACVFDLNRFFFKRVVSSFLEGQGAGEGYDYKRLYFDASYPASPAGLSLREILQTGLGEHFTFTEQLLLDTRNRIEQPTDAMRFFEENAAEAGLLRILDESLAKVAAVREAGEFYFSLSLPSQVFWSLYLAVRLKKINPGARFAFGGTAWRNFLQGNKSAEFLRLLGAKTGLQIEKVELKKPDPALTPPRSANARFPGILKHSFLTFQLTQSCKYGKCTFCYFPQIQWNGRNRTQKELLKDLRYLVDKTRPRKLLLSDAYFPASDLTAVLREIPTKKIREGVSCFARFEAEYSDHAFTRELYARGLRDVFIGLESGSTRILELMEKGIDLGVAEKNLESFYRAGIRVHLSLIVGFPTETTDEVRETVDFIRRSRKYLRERPQAFRFVLDPGTPVAKNTDKFGISRVLDPESIFYPSRRIESASGMSLEAVDVAYNFVNEELDHMFRAQRREEANSLGGQTEILIEGRLA